MPRKSFYYRLIGDIKKFLTPFYLEVNDEILRTRVTGILSNYLDGLKLNDYTVLCNSINNTPEVIDNRELRIDCSYKKTDRSKYKSFLIIMKHFNIYGKKRKERISRV